MDLCLTVLGKAGTFEELRLALLEGNSVEVRRVQELRQWKCRGLLKNLIAMKFTHSKEQKASGHRMSGREAAFALPIPSKLFRARTRLFLITHGGGKWSFIPSVANAWGTLSEMLVIPKPLSGDLRIAKVAVKPDG